MRNLAQNLRRSHKVVALFVLMVLLPAAVFTSLIVRAARSERMRQEYEKTGRQQQIVRLVEADLTNWLFAASGASARAGALLRFEVRGNLIVFPEHHLSLAMGDSPQQRPFDAGPPELPLTPQAIRTQYLPRIQAFRRDVATGRTAGAQYFRQLRSLVVQPPGSDAGYMVDIEDVLGHVNGTLERLSASEPFTSRAWIAAERTSRPPAGSVGLEGFPFFEVIFEDVRTPALAGLREQAFSYSMSLLVLVTVLGSVFVYRAVSQEARLARLRNDFVAAVSHEFRSPLSSILALGERPARHGRARRRRSDVSARDGVDRRQARSHPGRRRGRRPRVRAIPAGPVDTGAHPPVPAPRAAARDMVAGRPEQRGSGTGGILKG